MKFNILGNDTVTPIYILVLLIMAILKMLGFSLLSETMKILVYGLILALAIVSIKTTSIDKISFRRLASIFVFLSVCLFVFVRDIFLLLPVIISLTIYWIQLLRRVNKPLIRFVTVGYGLLILFIGSVVLFMNIVGTFFSFGGVENVGRLDSPNGNFSLVIKSLDAGATGGNVAVDVERSCYFVKWERRLYIGQWGENPVLKWNGDYEAIINNHKLNIFTGNLDSRRK